MPLSSSFIALNTISLILPGDSGFSSNITERETNALFTSKYGFSVVAPINIIVPSSTKGRR